MKCSVHAEVEAVGMCVHCGKAVCSTCRNIVKGKIYCPACVSRVFDVVERKRTGKPVAGGILGIIAGVFAFIVGVILVSDGATAEYYWESADWAEVGWGIALLVLGILAIFGSSFAVNRGNFALAILGGICALFACWPLGIPALVLISISHDEFKRAPAGLICTNCGLGNPRGSRFCMSCGRDLTASSTGS